MKQSLRHILMGHFALAAGALVASCGAEAPSEPELGRHGAELRSAGAVALAALEDSEPPPSECECGPLISWPPPECPRTRWFCNAIGDCSCAPSSGSSVLEGAGTLVAESALAASEPERQSAPPLESTSPVSSTHAARIVTRGPELPDLPLSDDGSDDCKCLGATVSPPQGGCALADWFCNASGLCRCRS